jgi:hypothetical protein
MAKAATRKKSSNQPAGVKVSRPLIAPVYGVPKHNKGLLDWSHVQERMTNAKVYWVCTVSPQGKPHATPVDGMWVDDKLYFGGDPSTKRNRNLDANPAVSVHLEEGYNVVILEGDALPLGMPDRELAVRLANASNAKYGYGFKPEDYTGAGTYVLRPRIVFAWNKFPMDITRWEFKTE